MRLNSIFKSALMSTLLVSSALQAKSAYVATTAIVEHPALDAVRDGIKQTLNDNGYSGENLKFTYESAQGKPDIASQIARKMVGENPDIIVAIATPSAQAAVTATKTIPVVFSAVTDPLAAKLVPSLEKPGGNVTGLSDMANIKEHFSLIKEFVPSLKVIGVPYNPGEANSVSMLNSAKDVAKEMGIKIVEAAAPKSSDVMIAAKQLVGKADAIYCPIDNTIISAVESVIKVGIDAQVPVFAGDTSTVERGAIAAVGYNYFDLGKQTGDIVIRILKGEKPGSIDVKMAKGTDLYVNPKMAKRMGIEVPKSVLEKATKIIK
jgi:putative ABC transport system substrate-binding protein